MILVKRLHIYLRLLRPIWHAALIGLMFFATYKLRLVTDLIPGLQLRIPPIDIGELKIFAVLSLLLFVVIGLFLHAYRFHFSLERSSSVYLKQRFLRLVAITFVAYFGHGFLFSSGISRFILIWTALLSGIVLSLFDQWYATAVHYFEKKRPKSVLCVSSRGEGVDFLPSSIQENYLLTSLASESWHDISYQKYDIVLVVGEFDQKKLQSEFDQIRLAHQTMYYVPGIHLLDNVVYSPVRIAGLDAFRCTPTRLSEWMIVVKRIVDIVGSGLGLVILSPLLFLIAVAIRCSSSGSFLYRQQRIGRNGRVFVINKFRTMYTHLSVGKEYGGEDAWKVKEDLMNSDANVRKGELQKIENDPRVTPIGRFLRRTSLDELPSLWNVLVGEMSLVGPRPHEAFEVERYKSRQRRLLSMKPGITGYAQINGRDTLSFDDEALYDLDYMQKRSFWKDLYIMVMTVKVVLKGR